MKNTFILKLSFLISTIAISYSCRNNDLLNANEYNKNNTHQLTYRKVKLNQSKHRLVLNNELFKIQNKLQEAKLNIFGKDIEYNKNFYIDTEHITYIENGPNYHTYTFNIIRKDSVNSTILENLVLTPLPDGTYKEILVSYNISPHEKQILAAGGYINTKDKVVITDLKKTSSSKGASMTNCGFVETFTIRNCSADEHGAWNTGEWDNCKADVKPGLHMTMTYRCDFISDTNNPGTGGDGGILGDGGSTHVPGGGSTVPCTGNGIATQPFDPRENLSGESCDGIPTLPTITLSTFFMYVKNLPSDLKDIINHPSNSDFYNELKNYYDHDSSDISKNLIKWALKFKKNNIIAWKEFQPMLTFAHNFLKENPDTINPEQIFVRLNELDKALIQNSYLLLDIPCNELDNWKKVANHEVSQNVKTKIQNIKNQTTYYNNGKLTDLDNGLGTKLNMDLFPVKITTLPNKPGTKIKYTTNEFFDFFRKNINQFAEKFTPIVDNHYGINDTSLWNSSNPLGSLIHIKIPIDDGTVVCSGYWINSWIFTTVKTPLDWSHDGIHPVAGNRLFSYYIDPNDNSMYIYTRGVDRVSRNYSDNSSVLNYLIQTGAFLGADKLWSSMQEKLSKFIINNGGSANKIKSTTYRPNYTKIKNYIKGNSSLSSLGCK
ncbi:hypothetical protein D1631_12230 [Chryseobacterium nematophagum]|uniref:Uncharacterized protein n=1 Tax=Chryseobacterium nematophagum TaxID=2305228 RepID=A0A3M7TH85_9FLAO|nr:hypothetical protein [Chryseobacterium nematophagum]RNA62648.1 hypothetical protein D1631_12230 [Chryseobacterium nematophagum]